MVPSTPETVKELTKHGQIVMASPGTVAKARRLLWVTTVVALCAPVAALGARWRDGLRAEQSLHAGLGYLDVSVDRAASPEALDSRAAEAEFGRAVAFDASPEVTRRARALWHVARAFGDLRQSNLVLASSEVQSALREAPEEPRVALAAAVLDLRRGESARAERRFLAVESASGAPTELVVRGAMGRVDVMLDAGRGHEALTVAETVARRVPASATVQNRLGLARRAVGDVDGARVAFLRAQTLDPQSPTALVNLAGLARARGELAEARTLLTQALRVAPEDGESLLALGVVLGDLGLDAEAKAALEHATRAMPEASAPWRMLGSHAQRMGRLSQAVAHFRTALDRDAGDAAARTNLGVALAQTGDRDGALRAFEEVTQRAPSTGEAWNGLGAMRLAMSDPEHAVGPLQQASVLLPDDPNPPMNLGLALERLQRWDDAARAFRECLRRRPGHEQAAAHLAALQPENVAARRAR